VSSDGRRLAYSSSSTHSTLWQLSVDRGGSAAGAPTPFYSEVVFRTSLPWFSPDGSRVAFFARLFGAQGNIWVMNADGTGAVQLTDSPGLDLMPNWSPDGSSIIYTRQTPEGAQVWSKSIADRSEKPLLDGRQVFGWPRLSPDGTELLYHQTHNGRMNLWVTSLPSGSVRKLTHDREGAGFPAWSPDGRLIAYELTRGRNTYLATMDRNGGSQTQLHADPVHNWCHSWSPDGRKILFAAFRDGAWNLRWIDRSTREQKGLTDYRSLAGFVRYPAWSPRGDRIVFEYCVTRGNIYLIDLEGGT
jgi:TolB protein